MYAEKMILKTDQHGHLKTQPELPPNAEVEAIFLVLKKIQPMDNSSFPSALIKGAMKVNDDLLSPVIRSEEWEESLERTARQLEGDESAFQVGET